MSGRVQFCALILMRITFTSTERLSRVMFEVCRSGVQESLASSDLGGCRAVVE